jgi:fatty-acyl-CoA synthase
MSVNRPQTLVDALAKLPRGEARGLRFIGSDRIERYFAWEAIEREAKRRAAILLGLGLTPGDRVALVIPDGHEFVLSFVGAACAGLVPVPIFPRATFKAIDGYRDTVNHIITASGATSLLTTQAMHAVLADAPSHSDNLKRIAVVETLFAIDALVPDDLCFLQFTSGSTSMPKGVSVTHASLVANVSAFLGPHGLDRRDTDIGVTWLPLFHDMGLIGFILGTLIADIPVVILPTETFARGPRIWLETIHKYRGTITYAPNFAFALATKRVRDKDLADLDLTCLRVAGCGAEPINAQVMREFAARFASAGLRPTALLPSYGMAEATLAITFHPHGTPILTDRVDAHALKQGNATASLASDSIELVSCGVTFPDHEVRVIDDQGKRLAERKVGEIIFRGPSVTDGYYNNTEATADCFRDGWLHTGDLGYVADGNLYVCGRIKDLIIIRGANFYPQDIEWAVSEIEGVRRGNVVAFSTQRDGEETLVIAAEGNSSDAANIRTAIASKVADVIGLKVGHVAVTRVGSLPKTSSGKVQRRKTKRMWEDGELEEHAVVIDSP